MSAPVRPLARILVFAAVVSLSATVLLVRAQPGVTGEGSSADLTIEASGVPSTVAVGRSVRYTFTMRNQGPDTAFDVGVSIDLDPSLELVETSGGSCSQSEGFQCALGAIEPEAAATLDLMLRTTGAGDLSSEATVFSSTFDPNVDNDSATVTTRVFVPSPTSPESPPATPETPPAPPTDSDGDGVPDSADDCPTVANAGQTDVNGDGLGDACEPVPPPEPGETADLSLTGGTVLVELPGSSKFVKLGPDVQIPFGSEIDTTHGKVEITSAKDEHGSTESAAFYGGVFTLGQTSGKALVTVVKLTGEDFGVCSAPARGRSPAHAEKRPHHAVGHLWGSGHGSFRSVGQDASATVRGTIWLTEDRCDGTLVRVVRGTVAVADFGRHRTVLVHAGSSYLARAHG